MELPRLTVAGDTCLTGLHLDGVHLMDGVVHLSGMGDRVAPLPARHSNYAGGGVGRTVGLLDAARPI
ncbi:hypothetical protein [Nocardia asiatica]|uniref:hypothetical protein n=1 Tax=Nocardia asiatica TaxID=209252 RepID=UPI002457AEDB|nr:hypothetical protein [Nocardia asiatica]